jgi:hypothetical protein
MRRDGFKFRHAVDNGAGVPIYPSEVHEAAQVEMEERLLHDLDRKCVEVSKVDSWSFDGTASVGWSAQCTLLRISLCIYA